MRAVGAWAPALGILALSCQKPLGDAECRRLLDHYTELLVHEETPEATPERVAHEQEEARAAARKDPRFEFVTCARRVSRRSYDCAMDAASVDGVERCLVF